MWQQQRVWLNCIISVQGNSWIRLISGVFGLSGTHCTSGWVFTRSHLMIFVPSLTLNWLLFPFSCPWASIQEAILTDGNIKRLCPPLQKTLGHNIVLAVVIKSCYENNSVDTTWLSLNALMSSLKHTCISVVNVLSIVLSHSLLLQRKRNKIQFMATAHDVAASGCYSRSHNMVTA